MQQPKSKSQVRVKCPECEYVFLPSLKEKQSRAGKAARRKGANFENKKAKEIAEWWNRGRDTNYEFKRTPMSGGSTLKEGFDMAGDICTNAPDFRYHLELKNAPSSFTGLHNFLSPKSKIWSWLEQASVDCPPFRVPVLIFNRMDMPTFCATDITEGDWITPKLERCGISYYKFKVIGYREVVIWTYKEMIESSWEQWK